MGKGQFSFGLPETEDVTTTIAIATAILIRYTVYLFRALRNWGTCLGTAKLAAPRWLLLTAAVQWESAKLSLLISTILVQAATPEPALPLLWPLVYAR